MHYYTVVIDFTKLSDTTDRLWCHTTDLFRKIIPSLWFLTWTWSGLNSNRTPCILLTYACILFSCYAYIHVTCNTQQRRRSKLSCAGSKITVCFLYVHIPSTYRSMLSITTTVKDVDTFSDYIFHWLLNTYIKTNTITAKLEGER